MRRLGGEEKSLERRVLVVHLRLPVIYVRRRLGIWKRYATLNAEMKEASSLVLRITEQPYSRGWCALPCLRWACVAEQTRCRRCSRAQFNFKTNNRAAIQKARADLPEVGVGGGTDPVPTLPDLVPALPRSAAPLRLAASSASCRRRNTTSRPKKMHSAASEAAPRMIPIVAPSGNDEPARGEETWFRWAVVGVLVRTEVG